MSAEIVTLGEICSANVLHTKWLVAPSLRIGHQWIESVARSGQPVVNLHPTTLFHLALSMISPQMAASGRTLASSFLGPLVVEATWGQLRDDGYLGRLKPTSHLASTVFESIQALRLAGCTIARLEESQFENCAKGADLKRLAAAFETFLEERMLVDKSDVFREATEYLQRDDAALGDKVLVIVPSGTQAAGLEQEFLSAIQPAIRISIQHPTQPTRLDFPPSNIRLSPVTKATSAVPSLAHPDAVQFFRAVGEVNEVREVLRRCHGEQRALDDVEILHTDTQTYVPLIYTTACRYACDPSRPDGISVTFAEGLPTSFSRPGRALIGWLEWINEGYPQHRMVEMFEEGLINLESTSTADEELSFSFLARLLRPIAIGWGAENYLRKLDEQIRSLHDIPTEVPDNEVDLVAKQLAIQRKRAGLRVLCRSIKRLLDLSHRFTSGDSLDKLQAAQEFLDVMARSVNELDQSASAALGEQLQSRQIWLKQLNVALDVENWLLALPTQTRVMTSGPRPGHLHVAHFGSGGHSGRKRTFFVGLDDRRFPGALLQDPILLDDELRRLNLERRTSVTRLHEKLDQFSNIVSRQSELTTLSWSCRDLADDRETFPTSAILALHRRIRGEPDADLESLNSAVGPPVSFAPATPEGALDESERWLWQLTRNTTTTANHLSLVEARYPHLARGGQAERKRSAEFGIFNGYVPRAGRDLDPFAPDGPVLSASTLETVGRCPLAYFFRNGLGLYPPDDLELDPDRWLNPAQFGLLLHDVFRQFMDELTGRGKRPSFDRDHVRLAGILREAVDEWRRDVPVPNENAYRMQYWQLIRTCRIFLQQEEELCRASQPRFFEVALGMERDGVATALDDHEPTEIGLAAGKQIRARGQIDRVDETSAGKFSVWDYKVGSGYGYDKLDPFRRGRRVQSILYLRMIQAAVRQKLDPRAVVEQFGYFFPSVRAQGLRICWNEKTLADGIRILEQLCDSIREGAFLATNNADDCLFCDYRRICNQFDQVTQRSQTLLQRDDLVPLRHLRELRRD